MSKHRKGPQTHPKFTCTSSHQQHSTEWNPPQCKKVFFPVNVTVLFKKERTIYLFGDFHTSVDIPTPGHVNLSNLIYNTIMYYRCKEPTEPVYVFTESASPIKYTSESFETRPASTSWMNVVLQELYDYEYLRHIDLRTNLPYTTEIDIEKHPSIQADINRLKKKNEFDGFMKSMTGLLSSVHNIEDKKHIETLMENLSVEYQTFTAKNTTQQFNFSSNVYMDLYTLIMFHWGDPAPNKIIYYAGASHVGYLVDTLVTFGWEIAYQNGTIYHYNDNEDKDDGEAYTQHIKLPVSSVGSASHQDFFLFLNFPFVKSLN